MSGCPLFKLHKRFLETLLCRPLELAEALPGPVFRRVAPVVSAFGFVLMATLWPVVLTPRRYIIKPSTPCWEVAARYAVTPLALLGYWVLNAAA